MLGRAIGATVVLLLIAVGVAVGATQTTTDGGGRTACVNDTNGLVRIDDTCRQHETAITLGGSDLEVSRGDTTLTSGQQAAAGTLPVSGIRLTATCEPAPPQFGDILNGRMRLTARSGETFDAFVQGGFLPSLSLGVSEALLPPAASASGAFQPETATLQTLLVKTSAGTVTLKIGGHTSTQAHTCRFSWQAEEVPA